MPDFGYLFAVTPTKKEIKSWLKKRGHTREWLGKQCGNTKKNTVNNWLSTSIAIPSAQLEIIRRLMAEDASRCETQADPQSHLVIRVGVDEFQRWEEAALIKDLTTTEYCIMAIREAYQNDQKEQGKTTALPAPGLKSLEAPTPLQHVADQPNESFPSILAPTAQTKYPAGRRRNNKNGTE